MCFAWEVFTCFSAFPAAGAAQDLREKGCWASPHGLLRSYHTGVYPMFHQASWWNHLPKNWGQGTVRRTYVLQAWSLISTLYVKEWPQQSTAVTSLLGKQRQEGPRSSLAGRLHQMDQLELLWKAAQKLNWRHDWGKNDAGLGWCLGSAGKRQPDWHPGHSSAMSVTCMNAILLHKFVKICLYLHMTALVAVAEGVVCTAHVQVTRLWLGDSWACWEWFVWPELTESSGDEQAAAAYSFRMSYMLENAASQGMSIGIWRHGTFQKENV